VDVLRFLLSGVCHGGPDHCLVYGGQALALCARCLGMHLGLLAALPALWLAGAGRRAGLPRGLGLAGVLAAVAFWAVDGLNSTADALFGLTLYAPSDVLRLLSGLGAGLALGSLVYAAWSGSLWAEPDPRPVLDRPAAFLTLLLVGLALGGLLLLWPSAPYWLWGTVAQAAPFASLACANGALAAALRPRPPASPRARDVALYLIIGLAARTAEMGAFAALRWLAGA
jgi:uncharacterized membrane protein